MSSYFSSDQVLISLKRLTSRKREGKTPMERTSALMYFLSFDAVSKKIGQPLVDLNPDKDEGKRNRKLIENEFTNLVYLGRIGGKILQVSELGKFSKGDKHPEKRVSSNFLTVPLKKASEQSAPYYYPKRPDTPLVKMGPAATGLKWGMGLHEDWQKNLPKIFSEILESTVFTDLAVYVMRNTPVPAGKDGSYVEALTTLLEDRYSAQLSKFWVNRMEREKTLARHLTAPFSKSHEPLIKKLGSPDRNVRPTDLDSMNLHIVYLETLLKDNGIDF